MKEKNVVPAAVRIVSRKCKNESSIDKHLLKNYNVNFIIGSAYCKGWCYLARFIKNLFD